MKALWVDAGNGAAGDMLLAALIDAGAGLETVRSGLRGLFSAIEVLPEKNVRSYRELAARHGCEPGSTWMIGNSPKSDINPALGAGLNAVFIPHDFTWVLEHEIVDAPRGSAQLLELRTFAELAQTF